MDLLPYSAAFLCRGILLRAGGYCGLYCQLQYPIYRQDLSDDAVACFTTTPVTHSPIISFAIFCTVTLELLYGMHGGNAADLVDILMELACLGPFA